MTYHPATFRLTILQTFWHTVGGRFGANGGVGSQAGTVTGTFTVTVMGI